MSEDLGGLPPEGTEERISGKLTLNGAEMSFADTTELTQVLAGWLEDQEGRSLTQEEKELLQSGARSLAAALVAYALVFKDETVEITSSDLLRALVEENEANGAIKPAHIDWQDLFGRVAGRMKGSGRYLPPARAANHELTPPSYLLSVSIRNVRCFAAAQTIDLSNGEGRPAPWTVILGNNGIGKTTLLQCIAAMDPTVSVDFLAKERLLARNLEMPLSTAGIGDSAIRESVAWSVAGTVCYGVRLDGRASGQSKATEVEYIRKYGYPVENRVAKTNRVKDLVCYGYGAARRMSESSLSGDFGAERCGGLFSDDVGLQNAEEWLLQSDYAAVSSPERGKARARLEQVKALLTDLLPDVDEVRLLPPDEDRLQASVEFKTPYGWVGIKQLSLGYRTLIAWMVDLARRMVERYPESASPISEPAIVLVDEIDLHLHPRWQRALMRYLTKWFPNTQFIVTAHSPLVAQAAANANIVLLRQDGDHVDIINEVTAIRGWRVDQLLTSDLFDVPSSRGPELDDLLAKREAILSQGVLTDEDSDRLGKLEAEIGELPTGESRQDMEAMDTIRQAAALLKSIGG